MSNTSLSQPPSAPVQLNGSRLCTNRSTYSALEERPITSSYRNLVKLILNRLQGLNTDNVVIRERQILNIESEVIKLNNDLLPGVVLTRLCKVLSALTHSQNIDAILAQKVNELNNAISDGDVQLHRPQNKEK